MSTGNWSQFNAHHLKHWVGRNASIKVKRRAISTAWRHLNTAAAKQAEVQAIQNGQARTLAQITANAIQAPAATAPPAPATTAPAPQVGPAPAPPPAPVPTLSQVQTIFAIDPVSSPITRSANAPEQHVSGTEEHGNPVPRGLLDREERMEDFSPEDPARPGLSRWLGGWKLGGRGNNKACVWIRFDDEENVVQRTVIKDVAPKPPNWVDMSRWEGDPRDLVNRVPLEYALHKRLCESDGREFFVNLLAYRSFPDRQMYRMILEYCDQDNAEQIADDFDTFTEEPSGFFRRPEPFFWRVLEHLVSAAIVMEQGSVNNAVEGWDQIVHRDLKADNVFMTTDQDCFYAKPLVSDFEFAIQTSESDPWNPEVYRSHQVGQSTGAWYCQPLEAVPREQIGDLAANSFWKASRILSPANVWCIGITMFTIMHGPRGRDQIGTQKRHRDSYRVNWNPAVADFYSETLVRTISKCLDNNPRYRPTLTELRGLFTRDDLPEDAQECRDARNARTKAELRAEWRCSKIADDYAVGLSRNHIVENEKRHREDSRRKKLEAAQESRRQHEELRQELEEIERQEELDAVNARLRQNHGPTREDEEVSEQEELEGSAQVRETLGDEDDPFGYGPNPDMSNPDESELGEDQDEGKDFKEQEEREDGSESMDLSE